MPIIIESVQIGKVLTEGNPDSRDPAEHQWTTGFYKSPVEHPVEMGCLGIGGDFVADARHHGGVDKAVLCYAADHYLRWSEELPDLKMGPGAFGENLTIRGVDEESVCIGDQFKIGPCRVEVSQPRQPCWKIARRWGLSTLTKHVTQTGRTGWYIRVLEPGPIQAGQEIALLDRPHPDWSIAKANEVLFGNSKEQKAVSQLMDMDELADAWKADLPKI
ncbi:MAG: MOSC domain-containing protein [Rhodopirellula sp.]|nr:MOSC domain-containing protein [Rhodopirellula sp.]